MRKTFNKLFLLFLVIGNITFNVCSAQPENDNNVDDERVEIDPDSDLSDDAIASASDSGKIQSGYQYVFGGASDLIGKGLFQNKTLAEYLFNSVANYSYSYNPVQYSIVPSVVNFGFGLNGGVSRNVIKNKDIYNSYSVIDKVYFKAGPSVGASYMGLSASLGLSFGFDYFNINIVKRRKRTEVLPLNQIEGKFKKAFKKESLKVKSKKEIEEENSKYSNFVDLTKAPKKYDVYLGRLWNPITMVFQLPLHYKMAKRMDDYEITSYSLNGGVSMGLGFSGGNIPGLDITKFGANLSIYFNGEHRVTVLKEKPEKPGDSFVRVMVSRKLNRGMGLSVGSTDDMLSGVVTTDNFAGNLGWNLFKGILDIKPFQFRMDKTWGNFYDTVYRYNLNTVEGRKAYNRACLGSFKLSEKYAFDKNLKPKVGSNLPVQRLVKRKGKTKSFEITRKIGLFLFKYKDHNKLEFKETKVINESNEENKIWESYFVSGNYRETLFAFNESSENKFRVKLNKNKFYETSSPERDARSLWKRANILKMPKDALTLFVTLWKRDDRTYFSEYTEYVKTIEEVLDRPGLFPLPPKTKFSVRDIVDGTLGKTEFRVVLNLDFTQLFKFMNYPKEKMWKALIKAFGATGKGWEDSKKRISIYMKNVAIYGATLPASILGKRLPAKDDLIVARLKLREWVKLQDSQKKGPEATVKAFGKFFQTGDYGDELTKLLRIVLKGEKVRFTGTARSRLILDHDIFKTDDRVIFDDPDISNFEKVFNSYRSAEIRRKGLNVVGLNARIIGKKYFRASFQLENTPQSLIFHLASSNFLGVFTDKSLETVVIENKDGMFKKGLNIIQVSLSNKKHPLYSLYSKIKPVRRFFFNGYLLGVAASKDKKNYGLMDYSKFDSMIVNDPKGLEAFNKTTVNELDICAGRFASELILLLGDNPLRVCPVNQRQSNGLCEKGKGMIPYSWYKNKPIEENLQIRDKWITSKCPVMEERDKVKKYISKLIVCSNKTGKEIIKMLKDDELFYVCNPDDERDDRGLCTTGFIPYINYAVGFEKQNLRLRNEWVMQFCPLTSRDIRLETLKTLTMGNYLKESTMKYIDLLKKGVGRNLTGRFNYNEAMPSLPSDIINFHPSVSGLISFSFKGKTFYNELIVSKFNDKSGKGSGLLKVSEELKTSLDPNYKLLKSMLLNGDDSINVNLSLSNEEGGKILIISPSAILNKFKFKFKWKN